MDFICIFDIIAMIPIPLKSSLESIIEHIKFLTKTPRSLKILFFQEIFHKNNQLYICIVLFNFRNIYVKYSHCGPINFEVSFYKAYNLNVLVLIFYVQT